jgi:hypothetical protein
VGDEIPGQQVQFGFAPARGWVACEMPGREVQVGCAPARGHHPGNLNHVSFVGVLGHYQAEQVRFDPAQEYQEVVPEQLVAQQVRFDPTQDYRPVDDRLVAQQVRFDPAGDYQEVVPEQLVAQQQRRITVLMIDLLRSRYIRTRCRNTRSR